MIVSGLAIRDTNRHLFQKAMVSYTTHAPNAAHGGVAHRIRCDGGRRFILETGAEDQPAMDPEAMFKQGFLADVYREHPASDVFTRFPPERFRI